MRKTLHDLYTARLPQRINMCEGDARMLSLVNAAEDRLMNRGSWWGTTARFKVCVTNNGCLAWPREVAAVLGATLCDTPLRLEHEWFKFSEYVTPEQAVYPLPKMVDMGMFPIVNQHTRGERVKAYALNAADNGKTITVQGLDANNAYATDTITLSVAGTVSTTYFNEITAVQKDETDYDVLLYGWDGTSETNLLGRYQPTETAPTYRWSKLTGLCCSCDDDCDDAQTLEVLVKLHHIDVKLETDLLIIQNTAALILAVESLIAEENGKEDVALLKWQKAIRELKHELATMTGNTSTIIMAPYGNVSATRMFRGFR